MKRLTKWTPSKLAQGANAPPPGASGHGRQDQGGEAQVLKIVIGVMVVAALVLVLIATGVFGSGGKSLDYIEDVAQHVPSEAGFVFAARSPKSLMASVDRWLDDDAMKELSEMMSIGGSALGALGEDAITLETLKDRGIDPNAAFGVAQWRTDSGSVDLFSAGAKGGKSAAERFAGDTLGEYGLDDDAADVEKDEIDGHDVYYAVSSASYNTRSVAVVTIGKRLIAVKATDYSEGHMEADPRALSIVEEILDMDEDDTLVGEDGFDDALKQKGASDFAVLAVGDSTEEMVSELGHMSEAVGDLVFALATFDISGDTPRMRAYAGLEDDDNPLLELFENESLSSKAFKWAPGPADVIGLFRFDAESILDDGLELAEDLSGMDSDDAIKEVKRELGVDVEDLFDAIGDEFGFVITEFPDDGNPNPSWMSKNVLFFLAITDSEPFVKMLEDAADDKIPGADFDEEGKGHLLSISEIDAGVGVDKKYLWIGSLDMVEDALGRDADSIEGESAHLINGFPKKGVMSISMRPEFLIEQLFSEWESEFDDLSLPDPEDAATMANFSLTIDEQVVVFDASIELDKDVAEEAFSAVVKAMSDDMSARRARQAEGAPPTPSIATPPTPGSGAVPSGSPSQAPSVK